MLPFREQAVVFAAYPESRGLMPTQTQSKDGDDMKKSGMIFSLMLAGMMPMLMNACSATAGMKDDGMMHKEGMHKEKMMKDDGMMRKKGMKKEGMKKDDGMMHKEMKDDGMMKKDKMMKDDGMMKEEKMMKDDGMMKKHM